MSPWVLASRPATLPAAAVPVLVGAAAAASQHGVFRPVVFAITLSAALLIQVGTNFANDYSDFHRGADTADRVGPVRVTQSGLLSQSAVRRGIVAAFSLATLLGLYLASVGGWPIVAIGVASVLCGLAYTGGPWPFGYHGLGDVFVFVFFGIIAVTGTAYLQAGEWSTFALVTAIPVGLLVTNILVINNLRDQATDTAAGKRTLAVRLGDRATRVQYVVFTALAYAVTAALAFASARPWLMLPWASIPVAVQLSRHVHAGMAGRDLNPVLGQTGRLLLLFGVLLALGLLLTAD